MTKNELKNIRYPYLDPLPKYSWGDLITGIGVLLVAGALGYMILVCY